MKRFLSILLAAALTVSMVSCSEGGYADTSAESSSEGSYSYSADLQGGNGSTSSKLEMGGIFSGLDNNNSIKAPVKENDSQTNKKYTVKDMDYTYGNAKGKYTGQVKGKNPEGYGQFVISDNCWLTCATWKNGVPDGPVNQYMKVGNDVYITDATIKGNIINGQQEKMNFHYTDNSCTKLDSIIFSISDIVNGDGAICIINNDGSIFFASGKIKDNNMTGEWKYYITDGEKILKEGTISDVKHSEDLLSKIGNILKGIGRIAKKAFTKIKDSIGNVINKFKGLPAEQKNRITKIGKYLGGKFVDKLYEDKQLEQQYKLKHPVKAACKELYNGAKDICEGYDAFFG